MGLFAVGGASQGNVMIAALHNGDGGNQRQLGIPLQIGDVGHAHVAHGGADFIQGAFHVVVERTGVGDVGIHALLKAQLGGKRKGTVGT